MSTITVRTMRPHADEQLATARYIEVYRRAWETQTLPETVTRLAAVRGVDPDLLAAALEVHRAPLRAAAAPEVIDEQVLARAVSIDLLNTLTNLQNTLPDHGVPMDAVLLPVLLRWVVALALRPETTRREAPESPISAIASWVGVHEHGWAFHAAGITADEYRTTRPSLEDALAMAALRHPRPLPPITTA